MTGKRQRDRERQKDRETERQRDRETERQRDRETERQRDRETERQRQRETERQRDREYRETERDRERERKRETERDRERQRETERDKARERERESDKTKHMLLAPRPAETFTSSDCSKDRHLKSRHQCKKHKHKRPNDSYLNNIQRDKTKDFFSELRRLLLRGAPKLNMRCPQVSCPKKGRVVPHAPTPEGKQERNL